MVTAEMIAEVQAQLEACEAEVTVREKELLTVRRRAVLLKSRKLVLLDLRSLDAELQGAPFDADGTVP